MMLFPYYLDYWHLAAFSRKDREMKIQQSNLDLG